jgi:hypothetical protein
MMNAEGEEWRMKNEEGRIGEIADRAGLWFSQFMGSP